MSFVDTTNADANFYLAHGCTKEQYRERLRQRDRDIQRERFEREALKGYDDDMPGATARERLGTAPAPTSNGRSQRNYPAGCFPQRRSRSNSCQHRSDPGSRTLRSACNAPSTLSACRRRPHSVPCLATKSVFTRCSGMIGSRSRTYGG
jgi:hypothetical protein